MRDVHPRVEVVLARERPVPDQRRDVRADERERHRHPVRDREPHPREQVVDDRVAEEPFEQRDHQDRQPDPVRQLARLAVGAREEDPQQVQDDRRDEDVRRPVVRLPDQEARLHGRRDVQHRAVGLGHLLPLKRRVRPVVDDLRGAVLVEERQVDARRDEHDERVERDLAEQERPVVREEVAQGLAQEGRAAAAPVDEADDPADHVLGFLSRTPHHEGPTGWSKLPAARSSPFGCDQQRQHRQLAAGGPEGDRPAVRGVERRVVARADERGRRLVGLEERSAVERDRAAGVRADLRVRDDPVGRVVGELPRQLQRALRQADEHERGRRAPPCPSPRRRPCRSCPPRCPTPCTACRARRRAGCRAARASCRSGRGRPPARGRRSA